MEMLQENFNVRPVSHTPDEDPEIIRMGEMLKTLRQKKGETLEHSANHLRISAKYLTAIEEHDLKALPEKVYALGFVRLYARHLGADAAHCSAVLKGALEQLERPMPRPFIVPDPVTAMPKGWMVLGGVIALALVYSLWRMMSSQNVPPSELALENQDIAALSALAPEAPEKPQERTIETPTLNAPQATASEVKETPPLEKLAIPAKEEASIAPEAVARPLPRDEQGGISFSLSSTAQLAVTATALSWVEIATHDGDSLINKNLELGTKESFSSRPLLYLSTGNAGALYVSINGQLYGPFGKDGEVLRHVPLHFHVAPAAGHQ